ncbi:lipocalin-like domain-containing protein [Sandaracinobacteroides sp. A072]|uniref:lipocalin-like domain-containing protein n=1 Tax=Sandaracinobacteroides sp. A072 TaxID=3461146 RepID=UPI0040438EA6
MAGFSARDLLGAWRLVSSINYRNEAGTPSFGTPPAGQIQYTDDGCMSAFLMDPEWVKRGQAEADSFTDFFAYAGHWSLEGDKVRHRIAFASVPGRVGTEFVRTVHVLGPDRIELVTEPETSKSGAVYITRLVWERVKPRAA